VVARGFSGLARRGRLGTDATQIKSISYWFFQPIEVLHPSRGILSVRRLLERTIMARRTFAAILFIVAAASPAFATYTLTTLSTFTGDPAGSQPESQLTLSGTTLYGTTNIGGSSNLGSIYSVPITGGTPTILASFNNTNGANPGGNVVVSGSTLYTTAGQDGAHGDGTIVSVPTSGGTPTILTSFAGTSDGSFPTGLILSGTTLYGVTSLGGTDNDGVVFSEPVAGGTPTVLTSFTGTDGRSPASGLVLSGTTLYGSTGSGGPGGAGEVFSLPISGGTPTIICSFNDTDGDAPGPITLSNGVLYGTTEGPGNGKIFSVSTSTVNGTPTILATFAGTSNGSLPVSALIAFGGVLYGTAEQGGANSDGVVFAEAIGGGTINPIITFNGTGNGAAPVVGLITDANNDLYGTTKAGGTDNDGTIFEVVPEPSSFCILSLGSLALLRRKSRAA